MNIPKQRMELIRKVGLFGLSDLRKLAPIGDLGYLNAIDYYRDNYPLAGVVDDIIHAFWQQKKKNGWTEECRSSRWRNSDNSYSCPELQMQWAIDSGD
jgi:hypothetical protein